MDNSTKIKLLSDSNLFGFIAGTASGVTKMIVGHPFDTLKVRLQIESTNKFKTSLHCLKETLKNEGFFALYKGATPPLLGWALIDSSQVGTYTAIKHYLINTYGINGYKVHAFSGLGGGIVSSFLATPIEQVKTKLQIQYSTKQFNQFHGPIDCIKQIIKYKGIIGLWNGWFGTVLVRSHFALFWPTYHWTLNFLNNQPGSSFLAGGIAATIFWTFAFPFDVVKNRIMGQSIYLNPPKYPNIINGFKQIYQTSGIKGFYRGFLPAMLRSFPTNGAALMVYEFVMEFKS